MMKRKKINLNGAVCPAPAHLFELVQVSVQSRGNDVRRRSENGVSSLLHSAIETTNVVSMFCARHQLFQSDFLLNVGAPVTRFNYFSKN